jgi:hypothetical protein
LKRLKKTLKTQRHETRAKMERRKKYLPRLNDERKRMVLGNITGHFRSDGKFTPSGR